ncbi:MAG: hypothetical protein WBC93_20290, partial [Sulfitobacter sp.]
MSRRDYFSTLLSLVEDDFWLQLAVQPHGKGDDLLSQFKAQAGIGNLAPEQGELLLKEYQKGYRSFLVAALEQLESFEHYALDSTPPSALPAQSPASQGNTDTEVVPYSVAVQEYLSEGQRGELWAAKTISEKRDALDLLGMITDCKPMEHLTKADARKAKEVVTKLPKNR